MVAKKASLKAKVIPTKFEAKETGLETIAIGAIPISIGLLQAGQLESGIAIGVIGLASLVVKYKTRA